MHLFAVQLVSVMNGDDQEAQVSSEIGTNGNGKVHIQFIYPSSEHMLSGIYVPSSQQFCDIVVTYKSYIFCSYLF